MSDDSPSQGSQLDTLDAPLLISHVNSDNPLELLSHFSTPPFTPLQLIEQCVNRHLKTM